MAIDAAVDGQGVALARSALAAWDLIGGRLVRPFSLALPASFSYWIVCPKATAKLRKIAAFTGWLLTEAAEDAARLKKLQSRSKLPGFAVPLDLIIFLLAAFIGALVAGLAGFAFGPNRIGNLAARHRACRECGTDRRLC